MISSSNTLLLCTLAGFLAANALCPPHFYNLRKNSAKPGYQPKFLFSQPNFPKKLA